jgi:hypothetical protein
MVFMPSVGEWVRGNGIVFMPSAGEWVRGNSRSRGMVLEQTYVRASTPSTIVNRNNTPREGTKLSNVPRLTQKSNK